MKFYLGVTDNEWFSFLAQRSNEDINFWQPSGNTNFKAIESGAPFLFKLKYPANAIGGIGFFSSSSILPLDVAWDVFKQRNGLDSYFEFKKKITAYRNTLNNPFRKNSNIGCIVLTDPIFFSEEDWIPVPSNWSKSIVQGKVYDTIDEIGKSLWNQVEERLGRYKLFDREESQKSQLILEQGEVGYSKKYLTKVRLGQGAFRVKITDAYARRCAISGEKTLPTLEAAHIKPYSESGPNYIQNGLLLRADLHKLFDAGYLTINKGFKVEVSRKIKEEFENGKDYYKLQGQSMINMPARNEHRPKSAYLDWHNTNIYNG
ncbi:HNH endonuclease [Flagellimonas meridianipacifica]|uniref:Putative restriction endonuclease n=1 Tax=Flagellimonas meridianipacifica TaxID=1080225 RepID=A0A2T0MIN5_9FLAO|nr:HNH endonuclease [Allomuricauda pacifica]PRX57366.1 putative restriction endonuclease [Allomuricauda pacifica]